MTTNDPNMHCADVIWEPSINGNGPQCSLGQQNTHTTYRTGSWKFTYGDGIHHITSTAAILNSRQQNGGLVGSMYGVVTTRHISSQSYQL